MVFGKKTFLALAMCCAAAGLSASKRCLLVESERVGHQLVDRFREVDLDRSSEGSEPGSSEKSSPLSAVCAFQDFECGKLSLDHFDHIHVAKDNPQDRALVDFVADMAKAAHGNLKTGGTLSIEMPRQISYSYGCQNVFLMERCAPGVQLSFLSQYSKNLPCYLGQAVKFALENMEGWGEGATGRYFDVMSQHAFFTNSLGPLRLPFFSHALYSSLVPFRKAFQELTASTKERLKQEAADLMAGHKKDLWETLAFAVLESPEIFREQSRVLGAIEKVGFQDASLFLTLDPMGGSKNPNRWIIKAVKA